MNLKNELLQGIEAHKQGKLQVAERQYRKILKANPAHPDANHNLGILALTANQPEAAIPLFNNAIKANPREQQFWISFVNTLIKIRHYKEAKAAIDASKKQGIKSQKLDKLSEQIALQTDATSTNSMSEQALCSHLLSLFEQGEFAQAISVALAVTERFPKNQFAWKALAGSHWKLGDLDAAMTAINKAIALNGKDAEAYCHLGTIQQENKQLEQAKQSYEKAIALNNKYAEAYSNLGVVLKSLGQISESIDIYKKAIELNPNSAEAHNNLGVSLQSLEQYQKARECFQKAIKLNPAYFEAYNNLGVACKNLNILDSAISAFEKAITLNRNYWEAHRNLGKTLKDQGKFENAAHHLKQALSINPEAIDINLDLSNALKELDKLAEAENCLRELIKYKPESAEAHSNLGSIHKKQGRLEDAEASYRKALQHNSELFEIPFNLGKLMQDSGRSEEAIKYYKQALSCDSEHAETYRVLSSMNCIKTGDEAYLKMKSLCQSEVYPETGKSELYVGLANIYEKEGEYEKAFESYSTGNALRKRLLSYNIEEDIKLFDKIKKTFSKLRKTQVPKQTNHDFPAPIFVLGMPRSGTTLVEQIISSHSQIQGAGELAYVGSYGIKLARGDRKATPEALLQFRDGYLNHIKERSEGKPFVTDKMPANFRFIGLINQVFPDAKIIHVQRDAAAVCWGNFKQYFVANGLGYSYDLADTVEYYKLYKDLMSFWYKEIDANLCTISYDAITENPESETKKLLDFLELDFEDACLRPEDNNRAVTTASNMQVRKGIYRGSSEQWKRYAPFLKGMLDDIDTE